MPIRTTAPLRQLLAEALPERPFEVAFWDGSRLPATNGDHGPTFTATGPSALAHLLRAPGQLGLGRAYADGSLTVDDIDLVMGLLNGWNPPPIDNATKAKLALAAVRATGPVLPPKRPTAELVPRGRRHSRERDARAVRHHYDVSNDYFRLFLGPSMTYSCAVFSRGATTLEEAQDAKLEMVCTKLKLQAGQRVLDVGCGWGSFALHAAEKHGVHVTGITLSPPQAELARKRAADAGLSDKIDIRVMDYRDLGAETFDAVSSIGMVEHVGDTQIDPYAATLASVLEPGGRLLNHGIARLRHNDPEAGDFSERFVFPDAAPLHLSRVLLALERAGFETEHTEGLRLDYAETLRHWATNFDEHLDEAIALGGAERARVWRLYLRAARHGFESGFTSIYQALVTRR
jgi:cyclopropane-fatty-acyl-phospholipid synthase